MRLLKITLALAVCLVAGSCAHPRSKLSASDLKVCLAEGGYQSSGPFGYPLCQVRYADAGKTCSGKVDCQGKCILEVTGLPGPPPAPGSLQPGRCEAERSTFGCYAVIDDGRVTSEGTICYD